MVGIPIQYRTKDFQNSVYLKNYSPLVSLGDDSICAKEIILPNLMFTYKHTRFEQDRLVLQGHSDWK